MYMQVVQESAGVVICSPARLVPTDCVVAGRVSDVTHIHPQEHRYVHAGGTRKCTCGDLFPG